MLQRSLTACAAAVLATAALSSCSSSDTGADASPSPATGCPVTVSDAWVKAVDSGMTAAFGTLSNPSTESVTITAATSPAAATVELHEVVDSDGSMIMRPVEGGFFVPAQGTQVLEPGGYHLMLMDVAAAIAPGDDVAFTLTCASGASMSFTAQAKAFDGADEQYSGTGDGMATTTPTPASS